MPTNVRDPRTVVTPDAFDVAPALLGLPLARPARRLGALLVDLTVVGVLTALLTGVQLFLWGTVALVLLWASQRRPVQHAMGPHATMLLRISLGCLGAGILSIVLLVAVVVMVQDEEDARGELRIGDRVVSAPLTELLASGGEVAAAVRALRGAETEEEAEAAAGALIVVLPDLDLAPDERVDVLVEITPEDASWRGRARDIYERVVAASDAAAREAVDGDPAAGAAAASLDGAVPVDSLSLEEALAEYARASAAGGAGIESERGRALAARLLPAIADDTLRALQAALDDEREERSDLEGEVARLEEEGSGFVALLRDVWEQLGSAIGLWSLYFTVLLTLGKGQTVGKRLFGIRVVRLDGEPLTWWSSFERVGGYAAGIATGLLGFAQVLWDANRQCVHDKIVGTVVVIAGAPAIPGSWVDARVADPDEGSTGEEA